MVFTKSRACAIDEQAEHDDDSWPDPALFPTTSLPMNAFDSVEKRGLSPAPFSLRFSISIHSFHLHHLLNRRLPVPRGPCQDAEVRQQLRLSATVSVAAEHRHPVSGRGGHCLDQDLADRLTR